VKLTVSGRVPGSTGTNNLTAILIGAAGLLLALVGAAIWFIRRRNQDADVDADASDSPDADATEDELLDAIVALDDLYQSGSLARDVYNERRASLKQALKKARNS
jgi:LPXTG-motif cell wall-anchored protein